MFPLHRSHRPRRPGLVAGVAATLVVGLLAGTPTPTATAAAEPAPTTACEAERLGEDMVPLRTLDLPVAGQGWRNSEPDYSWQAADQPTVDRVGYCLELGSAAGQQWAWAAFDATGKQSDTALPTTTGQLTRQPALGLTTRSNQPHVLEVTDGTGWLEMWPNGYGKTASRQVPGSYAGSTFSLDATYDTDDTPNNVSFGSFQVHAVDPAAGKAGTVLAVNRWATRDAAIDLGIGPSAGANPDWTFSGNAGQFTTRRLTFYGRPATVELDRSPTPGQLLVRPDHGATSVTTTIAGRVVDPAVTRLELHTERNGRTRVRPVHLRNGRFMITEAVPVALVETNFELWAVTSAGSTLVKRIPGVVAGDVYVVHGQSNAEARRWGSQTAHHLENRFIRSYGTPSLYSDLSTADDVWHRGIADTGMNSGAVGQWAIQFTSQILAQQGIPVGILQGSHGGRPISWFLRNDDDHGDVETNYGRLLTRLRTAGLDDRVTAVIWNQGENDGNDAAVHVAGATDLITDLREDLSYGTLEPRVYVQQVRRSPCNNPEAVELRDGQRRLGDTLGVGLISLNGMEGAVGCHWNFLGGYRELGRWTHALLAADVYGAPAAGTAAPNPARVRRVGPNRIAIDLRDRTGVIVEPGAGTAFRVNGEAVVTDVSASGAGTLLLTTSVPVQPGDVLDHVGHPDAGPWVRNQDGMGLLTFREIVG
ncbi:sialate O-acetylesterase [Propionibacteriaceae bacterium Y2011]